MSKNNNNGERFFGKCDAVRVVKFCNSIEEAEEIKKKLETEGAEYIWIHKPLNEGFLKDKYSVITSVDWIKAEVPKKKQDDSSPAMRVVAMVKTEEEVKKIENDLKKQGYDKIWINKPAGHGAFADQFMISVPTQWPSPNQNKITDRNELLRLFKMQYDARDWNSALAYLMRADELYKNDAEILGKLALVYFQRNDIANAELYFKKALEVKPEDTLILASYEKLLYLKGDLINAAKNFKKRISLENLEYRTNPLLLIKYYQELMNQNPQNWELINLEGWLYFFSESPDFALHVAEYLITYGSENSNEKILCFGKDLKACVYSKSDNIEDLNLAIQLFEEVKAVNQKYYTHENYQIAREKILKLKNKDNKND